jgi:hypothetical protein
MDLYNESGGSSKSSKYVKPFVCTAPETTNNALTLNGDSSKRSVSLMISIDLLAAAYVLVVFVKIQKKLHLR